MEGIVIVGVVLLVWALVNVIHDRRHPKPQLTEEELDGIVFMGEESRYQ